MLKSFRSLHKLSALSDETLLITKISKVTKSDMWILNQLRALRPSTLLRMVTCRTTT